MHPDLEEEGAVVIRNNSENRSNRGNSVIPLLPSVEAEIPYSTFHFNFRYIYIYIYIYIYGIDPHLPFPASPYILRILYVYIVKSSYVAHRVSGPRKPVVAIGILLLYCLPPAMIHFFISTLVDGRHLYIVHFPLHRALSVLV